MIHECNSVSRGGHTYMGDPTGSFVEGLADGILQAVLSFGEAYNYEFSPVGRPVGGVNMLKNLPGRSTGEWHSRKRGVMTLSPVPGAPQAYRQLTRPRYCHDVCV